MFQLELQFTTWSFVRGPSAMKLKGPLLTIILMYITRGAEAGITNNYRYKLGLSCAKLRGNLNLSVLVWYVLLGMLVWYVCLA